jgi:hypothetical protein
MANVTALVSEVGAEKPSMMPTSAFYAILADGHSEGTGKSILVPVDGKVTKPGTVQTDVNGIDIGSVAVVAIDEATWQFEMPIGLSGRFRLDVQVKWEIDGVASGAATGKLRVSIYKDSVSDANKIEDVDSDTGRDLTSATAYTEVLQLDMLDFGEFHNFAPGDKLIVALQLNVTAANGGDTVDALVYHDPATAGNEFIVAITPVDRPE